MSIDIYRLTQLSAFTKFANDRINNNNEYAIASSGNDSSYAREIKQNSNDTRGTFFAFFRSRENRDLNNATRTLFKDTVAGLFGGEKNIPQEVKNAMHMKRFNGDGRPLTARRINDVKDAILAHFKSNQEDLAISYSDALRVINGAMTLGEARTNAADREKLQENDEEFGIKQENIKEPLNEEPKVSTGNDKTTVNNDIISQPEISTGDTK